MFLRGYMIMALSQSMPNWMVTSLFWIIIPFVFTNPIAYAKLPRCFNDAEVKKGEKYPLLVFSHGLSGTGCEHGLMGGEEK
jgi:hypothetical protein